MILFSSKYARFSEMGAGASGVILWGKKCAAEAATVVFGIAR
jgi:hypothetical protein